LLYLIDINMRKSKYHNRFWVCVTTILSVVFAILFFTLIIDEYSFLLSALFTAIGVIFIWIVYFVRVLIFTVLFKE